MQLMTVGQGLRMALSALPPALAVAAVVTAPTLVLEGRTRWWGLLAGLLLLMLCAAFVKRGLKRGAARGFVTSRSFEGEATSFSFEGEATPRPLPADFDPEKWMARSARRATAVNRVAYLLLLAGLTAGVGLGVAVDSAAVSVAAGALGLLLGGAAGATWAWLWFRSLSRLSSG